MNLEEIVKVNKQTVKNLIKSLIKKENEDLEQEVYIKLLKNSDKYQEQGNFSAWLKTVVVNTVKDFFKSSCYKKELSSVYDESIILNEKSNTLSPEDKVISIERQKYIINAIDNLKPKFREVIMLCEIYGYSYEQAAKKLNCPLGTIKSRIYNAKKILATEFEQLL